MSLARLGLHRGPHPYPVTAWESEGASASLVLGVTVTPMRLLPSGLTRAQTPHISQWVSARTLALGVLL